MTRQQRRAIILKIATEILFAKNNSHIFIFKTRNGEVSINIDQLSRTIECIIGNNLGYMYSTYIENELRLAIKESWIQTQQMIDIPEIRNRI